MSLTNRDPSQWGPVYWKMIAIVTSTYPISNPEVELQQSIKTFFQSFGDLLPCEKCRVHYADWLKSHPVNDEIVQTKKALETWVSNMKHSVSGEVKDNVKAQIIRKRFVKPVKLAKPLPRHQQINPKLLSRTRTNNIPRLSKGSNNARISRNIRNVKPRKRCNCGNK